MPDDSRTADGALVGDRRRLRTRPLPPALQQAIARNCALVVHSEEVDEYRYDVFEVHQDQSGVVVYRRCWWFDEETEQWSLDESSEWFFTAEQAMQLGAAINQAGLPSARRSAG